MRKANPAFCDRSKSHKKLDPFDDRKMVHWLAENPFLVRSSTISVRVPMTALVYACACVRACAADMSLDVAPHVFALRRRGPGDTRGFIGDVQLVNGKTIVFSQTPNLTYSRDKHMRLEKHV